MTNRDKIEKKSVNKKVKMPPTDFPNFNLLYNVYQRLTNAYNF